MRIRRLYTFFTVSALLAAAGLARAGCASGGITFASQSDVDVANCTFVNGDVVISATAPGNITFNDLKRINGSLIVQGCGDATCSRISGISSTNLTTINGRLQVSSVPSLKTITLPGLQRVDHDLLLQELPELNWVNMTGLKRAGSLKLYSAPKLITAQIGVKGASFDPNIGLKNITGNLTGSADAVVELRNVGLRDLDGILDFWSARRLLIDSLPNLNVQMIKFLNVDEMRVVGNDNLTLRFWESNLNEPNSPGPVINRLVVSNIRSLSPCLQPVVHEFLAFNNSAMEYLYFNFDQLNHIEIRNNPRLKKLVSWAPLNRFWRDIYIHDNPLLSLKRFPGPREPGDNVSETYCRDIAKLRRDQWAWFPNTFDNLVIAADIDNSFFNETFTNLWLNTTSPSETKPKVVDRFEVNSTNKTFDCSALDILRTQKGAFPGRYSCQGQTLPAGIAVPSLEGSMRMALGAAFMAAVLLY
ncbi:hypothetical protein GGTG_05609 [Gaeumannomyces tritici R3-111a-1]|uniref:Uncharacterized protein n=1 Tax=Gaeumannomyces tritici (strain R3-111a-1) TaxID=644352 RepID=J3NWE5_GAET3|nr:hypothetical protein GGTG_05609 [Gaeumannomyces tritici R3-111a-1]EJT75677.1 hypothetical protein GGTG_05609 [Gaeumannomyces tritici R3-111a-1]